MTDEKRVRVDSMKRGDRFVAVGDGKVWTFERQDGGYSGAYHCVREDGYRSCFAGCAEGTPVT